jgi:spoIIIJ-associated protein
MREMGMEASVSAREHEGDVWIDVESDVDDALLIGRRGETRNAIQHIVQRLIGPRAEMAGSVIVDVNSYWQRRMARLADEARSLAEEAVATGREQRTEPLNAQERTLELAGFSPSAIDHNAPSSAADPCLRSMHPRVSAP